MTAYLSVLKVCNINLVASCEIQIPLYNVCNRIMVYFSGSQTFPQATPQNSLVTSRDPQFNLILI